MGKNNDIKTQITLYLIFAALMIGLNYLIQKINQLWFAPFFCTNFGHIDIIKILYCSTEVCNMPELVGSIIAVGITYIIKFFLDKLIVFKKKSMEIKETSQQFMKYFLFAILTTIENVGIQFIFTNFIGTPLEISSIIALSIGYLSKFFLDKKFVFIENQERETD